MFRENQVLVQFSFSFGRILAMVVFVTFFQLSNTTGAKIKTECSEIVKNRHKLL